MNEPAGSYRCGNCPPGLSTVLHLDESSRLNGSSCVFPPAPPPSDDASQMPDPIVRPVISLGFEVAEDFAPVVFSDELRHQIAIEMSVDPSEIEVGLQDEGRRRLQTTVQCHVTILADVSVADIGAMGEQLSDQDSPLWRANPSLSATVTVLPGQMTIGFQCPVGSVMGEGSCRRCPIGQFSSVVGAACSKCPLGQTNDDARDGCQCMPDFYNKTLGVKCFKMGYTGSPKHDSDGHDSI